MAPRHLSLSCILFIVALQTSVLQSLAVPLPPIPDEVHHLRVNEQMRRLKLVDSLEGDQQQEWHAGSSTLDDPTSNSGEEPPLTEEQRTHRRLHLLANFLIGAVLG